MKPQKPNPMLGEETDSRQPAGKPFKAWAKILYETKESLDPSPDSVEWSDLSDWQQEVYRLCVETILRHAGMIGPPWTLPVKRY